MTPRFQKLSTDDMSPLQREVAAEISAGPRGEVRGPFVALIHHAALARHIQHLGEFLRFGASLPLPLLEMAILMTARRWTCQHEWYAHERLARKVGLEEHIISALMRDEAPEPMSEEQREVYAFCKEAHAGGQVSDGPFEAVKARFGHEGVLELLCVSGYYSMMAMVLNTARMPLPDNAPPPLAPL
jgi:4-carboxymuconolactone decarboxylase